MISKAVDHNCKGFITILSADEIVNIYQSYLVKDECICSNGCFSYRKLANNLNMELHAIKKTVKKNVEYIILTTFNYIHKAINDYFKIDCGIASKHLHEYLSFIVYKCMYKLRGIHSTLYELVICDCGARWKDYFKKILKDHIV